MVCDKCVGKLAKLATVHVDKNQGPKRVTNEHKLLSSQKQFKATGGTFRKCRLCKMLTHHSGAHYCQNCAFQKGICAMCGRKMNNVAMSRQTLV